MTQQSNMEWERQEEEEREGEPSIIVDGRRRKPDKWCNSSVNNNNLRASTSAPGVYVTNIPPSSHISSRGRFNVCPEDTKAAWSYLTPTAKLIDWIIASLWGSNINTRSALIFQSSLLIDCCVMANFEYLCCSPKAMRWFNLSISQWVSDKIRRPLYFQDRR